LGTIGWTQLSQFYFILCRRENFHANCHPFQVTNVMVIGSGLWLFDDGNNTQVMYLEPKKTHSADLEKQEGHDI
jgi:hypothetical protein